MADQAGDRAQRAYAWLTAAERFRAAAALLAGIPGEERTRGRLLYRLARLQRFSDPDGAIEALDEAARLADADGDAVLAAEVRWLRGNLLCYADKFRSGVAEIGDGGNRSLEALPWRRHGPAAVEPWFADAIPDGAGRHGGQVSPWRILRRRVASGAPLTLVPCLCRTSAAGIPIVGAVRCGARRDPGATGGIRSTTAFAPHGLGVARRGWAGQRRRARHSREPARSSRNMDHHALIAFTLLSELRDVALTYDAADPARRRRSRPRRRRRWHELEALSRRASRPPGLARLPRPRRPLGGGGPDPAGSAAPRQRLPAAGGHRRARHPRPPSRRAGARLGGDPPLFPHGPATEPGDLIHQEGLFLQRLAADLCLDAGDLPGAGLWLEAHDRWLAWSESVLGRAEGQLAWARYHWASGDAAHARAAADRRSRARRPAGPASGLAGRPPPPRRDRDRGRRPRGGRGAPGGRARSGRGLRCALRAGADPAGPGRAARRDGAADEAATLLDEVRQICTRWARRRRWPVPTRLRLAGLTTGHRAASRRADSARGGGTAPPAARALQRRDRARALRQPPHRADPPHQSLRQARGWWPRRGGGLRHGARAGLIRINSPPRTTRLCVVLSQTRIPLQNPHAGGCALPRLGRMLGPCQNGLATGTSRKRKRHSQRGDGPDTRSSNSPNTAATICWPTPPASGSPKRPSRTNSWRCRRRRSCGTPRGLRAPPPAASWPRSPSTRVGGKSCGASRPCSPARAEMCDGSRRRQPDHDPVTGPARSSLRVAYSTLRQQRVQEGSDDDNDGSAS